MRRAPPRARAGPLFAKGPRTARSLVFLFVTAEEKGLLGSEYYVSNPLYPLAKTAGVLNTDGGALFGRSRDFTISGSAKLGLLDMLVAEAAKQQRTYSPDDKPEAATSSAPITSPLPSAAFRPSAGAMGRIW
jgi:Zn-dependent M28 family amino/carboxypeptidase